MKKTISRITILFFVLLCITTAGLYFYTIDQTVSRKNGMQLVMLNEIKQETIKETGNIPASDTFEELEKSIKNSDVSGNKEFMLHFFAMFLILGLLYTVTLFVYVYHKILRPFEKLEKYAEEIAGGNLEVPLEYERTNFFGEFTWAFDHMRKEIIFAKNLEKEAIESNKTIIAALSHDIKTPIASIRAYSEGLEANLDAKYEKRQRYVSTIMRKCDEVTTLVNDLVLHSLSELQKIDIKLEEVQIDELIRQTVQELEFDNLKIIEPLAPAKITGDAKRIAQIIENLLNNSRKYAPESLVEIYSRESEHTYSIHVRDHGNGIPPEDMPFIKDKFYRGKNAGDMPGSGLGLYIVDYILREMKGELILHNDENGLDVEIVFVKSC